tara:strand:- start:477 stop:629 length:153 start_codon:yes stop_codon:yes gene_type:complete
MKQKLRWEEREADDEDKQIYGSSVRVWVLMDYSGEGQIVETKFTNTLEGE